MIFRCVVKVVAHLSEGKGWRTARKFKEVSGTPKATSSERKCFFISSPDKGKLIRSNESQLERIAPPHNYPWEAFPWLFLSHGDDLWTPKLAAVTGTLSHMKHYMIIWKYSQTCSVRLSLNMPAPPWCWIFDPFARCATIRHLPPNWPFQTKLHEASDASASEVAEINMRIGSIFGITPKYYAAITHFFL